MKFLAMRPDAAKHMESALWFTVFKGEHINDARLTRAEKIQVRAALARTTVVGGTQAC